MNKKTASLKFGTILTGCLCILTSQMQGALVAYEGFDYTPGTNIVGASGGFGWATNWAGAGTNPGDADVTSPGLTYSSLDESGNKLVLESVNAAHRNLTDTFDGQDIWLSVILGPMTTNTSSVALRDIGNDSIGFRVRAGGSHDELTIETSLGNNIVITEGDGFINNQELFIVMQLERINDGNDILRLWLNPDVGVIAPQNYDVSGVLNMTGSFGDLNQARLFANNGTPFDELRIGETFASVTPIPEPTSATIVMLIFAGTFCLLRYRNRSRQ